MLRQFRSEYKNRLPSRLKITRIRDNIDAVDYSNCLQATFEQTVVISKLGNEEKLVDVFEVASALRNSMSFAF